MKKLSTAHQRSASSVIDPLYSATRILPALDIDRNVAPWLYGENEFECWRLKQLRRQVEAVELKVGYPGEFHQPAERVWFRHPVSGEKELAFRASGKVTVRVDGKEIYRAAASDAPHRVIIPGKSSWLLVEVSSTDDLPGLQVESGGSDCQWSCDGCMYHTPAAFQPSRSGVPPHRAGLSTTELFPESQTKDIFDFGRELFGRVLLHCSEKPSLAVGESREEALNENRDDAEQSTEVIAAGKNLWISKHPLAFRFVRAGGVENVSCLAEFYPVCYRGAFACSDPQLTDVWSRSAYTLRLCMQDFLLDGLKRDRLPWVGDLMVSLMVNAYVFADAEIVRRTLSVLGRAGISSSHLNGIIDYSLWWVICHHHFQLYFADVDYLRREWRRIKMLMACLESQCDADGILIPDADDWLLIDWGKSEKNTALQMLWHWALISAAKLAERLGENTTAANWQRRAGELKSFLLEHAWSTIEDPSRHAQFLSVLAGVARPEQFPAVKAALLGKKLPSVGTPYMACFENLALAKLDAVPEMLARVKHYWGGMLEHGATTFWEAYDADEKGNAMYAFYERPFGKSLCHAWSAGPAAFLPTGILGLEVLEDGWKRFVLNPDPDCLEWVAVAIPTPRGTIEITLEAGVMSLCLPPGCTAEYQGRTLRGKVEFQLT